MSTEPDLMKLLAESLVGVPKPVHAIQHPDGYFYRITGGGAPLRFSSTASARAHIDTLPCNGYTVVRYN